MANTSGESPNRNSSNNARIPSNYGADFFGYEEDEFGPKDNSQSHDDDDAPLSWRLNASDSLSDWKIVITRSGEDSSSAKTYHVHKNILAVGPRKSEYFSGLFKNTSSLAESSTSTSTIGLEDSAAEAFPIMLDFMYSSDVPISTNNAVALRHLARYFGIRRLFLAAAEFIRNDMKPETAAVYLSEAAVYCDDKLVDVAGKICAEHMAQIETDVLAALSPRLFTHVVTSEKLQCDSQLLSCTVAAFCEAHPTDIDNDLLKVLTDHERMPSVDPNVGISLLKFQISCEDEHTPNTQNQNNSLHNRCIEALSESWEEVLVKPLRDSTSEGKVADMKHKDLPVPVQLNLLELSLCRAKTDVETLRKELQGMCEQIRAAANEKRRLCGELAKFIRVPNSHTFGEATKNGYMYKINKRTCTYEHGSVEYGEVPPSAGHPLHSGPRQAGYVYEDGRFRWPVYYYKP